MSQASVTELYQDDDQRGAKRGRLRHEPGKHLPNFRRRKVLRKKNHFFFSQRDVLRQHHASCDGDLQSFPAAVSPLADFRGNNMKRWQCDDSKYFCQQCLPDDKMILWWQCNGRTPVVVVEMLFSSVTGCFSGWGKWWRRVKQGAAGIKTKTQVS